MTTVTSHWFVLFVLLSIHAHALTVPLRLIFKIWGYSFLRLEFSDESTKQRREKDKQRNKIQQFLLHFRLAGLCYVLYRSNSRGTQTSRTSSSDQSQSATFCDQMKKEVLQEVQQNYERWQINKDRNSEGTWHEAQGKVIIFKLLERSTPLFELYTTLYTTRAVG